jgi:predicted dinucleotide-utilizing enzyme
LRAAGPNDRIGVAMIGVGTRGDELLRQVQSVPGVEVRVICDLYQGNIKRALEKCENPKVRVAVNVWPQLAFVTVFTTWTRSAVWAASMRAAKLTGTMSSCLSCQPASDRCQKSG